MDLQSFGVTVVVELCWKCIGVDVSLKLMCMGVCWNCLGVVLLGWF